MWTRQNPLLKIVLSLSLLFGVCTANPTVTTQPKACNRTESYNMTVLVSEQKAVRVREYVWCLAVPPRCSREITKVQTITRNQTTEKTVSIAACCEGYRESPDGDTCIPICNHGCVHGTCVEPDTCVCWEHHGGPDCKPLNCPEGKWGDNCTNTCPCLHGSRCDQQTGQCNCPPEWQGRDCRDPCANGKWKLCAIHLANTIMAVIGRSQSEAVIGSIQ